MAGAKIRRRPLGIGTPDDFWLSHAGVVVRHESRFRMDAGRARPHSPTRFRTAIQGGEENPARTRDWAGVLRRPRPAWPAVAPRRTGAHVVSGAGFRIRPAPVQRRSRSRLS